MTPVTKLWLIRHGEPVAEVRGRCYGRLDAGLSAAGREQAARVAEHLAGEAVSAVYASPRARALETARIIAAAQGCGAQVEEDLREIDFGDFEGLSYDEIARRDPEIYRQWMERPTEVEFPNGESFARLRARVLRAAGRLLERHAGGSVVAVTHGGVIRAVLAEILGIPPANIFRIGQAYAAMNLVRYVGEHPVVERVNGYSPGGQASFQEPR